MFIVCLYYIRIREKVNKHDLGVVLKTCHHIYSIYFVHAGKYNLKCMSKILLWFQWKGEIYILYTVYI